MKGHTISASTRPSSALLLVLAGTACSGDYPLGKVDNQRLVTDGTDVVRPGTSGLIGSPDETLSLEDESGSALGNVTAIGDFDGDGYDDLMASGWDAAQRTGFVQVHYGGTRAARGSGILPFDPTGTRLVFPRQYDDTTPMLTPVGDVDGDGYADVLIRRNQCRAVVEGAGAYLLYGGPERFSGTVALASVAAAFLTPAQHRPRSWSQTCETVLQAAAGDLDGDGFSDLVLNTGFGLLDDDPGSSGAQVFYGGRERFSGEVSFGRADAQLRGNEDFLLYVAPDLNGDGRADLMLGKYEVYNDIVQSTVFFFPGSPVRLSGDVDVESSAIRLEAGLEANHALGSLDLDGDGMTEVMLQGTYGIYLFYGAPDLFAKGGTLPRADAVFDGDFNSHLMTAGDRDGDGDDELLQLFEHYDELASFDAALLSGEQTRLSGPFTVPGADADSRQQFPDDPARAIQTALAGGDLDRDGIGDLLTESGGYLSIQAMPWGSVVSDSLAPQLHIYYGVPAIARIH